MLASKDKLTDHDMVFLRVRVGSKSLSSKAVAIIVLGAYSQNVSMRTWRQRRWPFFSTDPERLY